MKILIIILALWNLAVFTLMGIDKRRAVQGSRRISEKTLLTASFLFGGVGGILGSLFFRHKTRKLKFRLLLPLSLIVNVILLAVVLNLFVIGSTYSSLRYIVRSDNLIDADSAAELTEYDADCALVLGCGVYADGSPTPMLKDRLDVAIALYESGTVDRLLLSGDHGQVEYNEIGCMFNYCLEAGLPKGALFLDHAGFSTYDSVYRAREIFEVKRMIIVTQVYHEFRALYIGRALGTDCIGVASGKQMYAGTIYREIREILARNKDIFKSLLRMPPVYGGDKIPITGDAAPSQV